MLSLSIPFEWCPPRRSLLHNPIKNDQHPISIVTYIVNKSDIYYFGEPPSSNHLQKVSAWIQGEILSCTEQLVRCFKHCIHGHTFSNEPLWYAGVPVQTTVKSPSTLIRSKYVDQKHIHSFAMFCFPFIEILAWDVGRIPSPTLMEDELWWCPWTDHRPGRMGA